MLKEELYKHLSNLEKNDRIEKTPMIIDIYSKNYPGLKLIDFLDLIIYHLVMFLKI